MKTTNRIQFLPQTGENVIILDGLEFGFPRWQLDEIKELWENGNDISFIAKRQGRKPDEVFLAIFHLSRLKQTTRKLDWKEWMAC